MPKIYTKLVEHCSDCPNCKQVYTFYAFCKLLDDRRLVNSDENIHTKEIPEDCPLEEI